MTIYSEELIDETIKCFAKENNHHIDRETAIVYLDSLASLYLSFADLSSPILPNHSS